MSDDPIRWAEGGGPPGSLELVGSLRGPPPLPPALRAMPRARPRRLAPRRIGAATATAIVVAGLVLWVFRPAPAPSSEPSREDAIAALAGTLEDAGTAIPPTAIGAAVLDQAEAPTPTVAPLVVAEPPTPMRRPRRVAPRDRVEVPIERTETPALAAEPGSDVASATEGTGYLVIFTLPWARVWIDGRDTGRLTPIRQMRVSAGRHTLGFVTPDGATHEVTIDVRAGETTQIVRHLSDQL